jgi:hypothetical protein
LSESFFDEAFPHASSRGEACVKIVGDVLVCQALIGFEQNARACDLPGRFFAVSNQIG